jgi:hypothetical protein
LGKTKLLFYLVPSNGRHLTCDMIYLLTAIGLTPGGSSTVHIHTQTVHGTTQSTTLVGRLSVIRTQSGQIKLTMKRVKNYSLRVRYTAGLKLIYAQP